MVELDFDLAMLVPHVDERIFHFELAAVGFAEEVVPHGDCRVFAADHTGVLEPHGRPGLQRKAAVFLEVGMTPDKVGKRSAEGRPELLHCGLCGAEEQRSVVDKVVITQELGCTLSCRLPRTLLADVDDAVSPVLLSGFDVLWSKHAFSIHLACRRRQEGFAKLF